MARKFDVRCTSGTVVGTYRSFPEAIPHCPLPTANRQVLWYAQVQARYSQFEIRFVCVSGFIDVIYL